MFKNIAKLELLINGRSYQFFCESDSPFPDLKEAGFQIQKYIGLAEDQAKAQQAQASTEKQEVEHIDSEIQPVEQVPNG